jgi:DNA-binding SARP family transcriptional activator
MMRLFVLGGLRVEHDAHAVELPAARKARLLLAVLAIERRPLGRSELAGRLWPDVLPDSARASLRNALAQLRAALGPVADEVIVADTAGALALGPDVWSDVAEVDRLLAAGRPEEAVAAIGGELLPGFDDDWVYEQRDDLRRRLVGSLEAAAADAEAGGELATAIRLSQHGADLEPLAERLHRDLIRRLAAGGDRGAALAAYERLRGRLADALHAAPSAPTRALVDQIRGGRGEPPPDQRSRIRYTRRDGHALAYQRFGSGPADLLVVPGWVSNLD